MVAFKGHSEGVLTFFIATLKPQYVFIISMDMRFYCIIRIFRINSQWVIAIARFFIEIDIQKMWFFDVFPH